MAITLDRRSERAPVVSLETETRNRPYEIREAVWHVRRELSSKAWRHGWKSIGGFEKCKESFSDDEFWSWERLSEEVIEAWEAEHTSGRDDDVQSG